MEKKIIKCSQCEEEFSNGYDYRNKNTLINS